MDLAALLVGLLEIYPVHLFKGRPLEADSPLGGG